MQKQSTKMISQIQKYPLTSAFLALLLFMVLTRGGKAADNRHEDLRKVTTHPATATEIVAPPSTLPVTEIVAPATATETTMDVVAPSPSSPLPVVADTTSPLPPTVQPSSATVVAPVAFPPSLPPPEVLTMAPTTTTTPANAPRLFEPVLPRQLPAPFSNDWTVAPFPDYALVDASAPRYPVDAYLYEEKLTDVSRNLVALWWQDVPASIHAIYFLFDRARFKPMWQAPAVIYSSVDEPRRNRSIMFSDADIVTNPSNPVEGAFRIYDKNGQFFKDVGQLNHFSVKFLVNDAEGPRSILDAASILYVDSNGKANFLALPAGFIQQPPPYAAP